MTALRPMTESEYIAWREEQIPAYAADKVASGQWSEQESVQLSAKEHAGLLPDGLATPGNHLFTIIDARTNAVGALWFTVRTRPDARIAYVLDVNVFPEHRREGHAFRAFAALEDEVRKQGLAGIALHVFGHNNAARALYRKLGFHPTNINLFKPVDPAVS